MNITSVGFRGYMVRRYQTEERRHHAAVKIQAHVCGYMQRLAYRRRLAEHRRNKALLASGESLPTDMFSWQYCAQM